jgi:hypothetical protein
MFVISIVEGNMINLESENSFIYRIIVPVMQVIAVILLLLALVFNNTLENISDIFRDISIAIQFLVLTILGVKELLVKKNKIAAYISFGFIIIGLIFIIYINVM